jgi:hypothetical protein
MTMVELSEDARKGLDDYLRQVRTYLRWSKSLDRNEIEQNITDHIERELESTPEPVSATALHGVLARLGSPRQWVPSEAMHWWGKLILKFRTDSEDWRLAYLSFCLLVAGFVLLFVAPLQLIFIAASFLAARAALAVAGEEDLGAQKWLIYPALVVISVVVGFVLLAGPGLCGGIVGEDLWEEVDRIRRGSAMGQAAFIATSATLVTGVWWVVLGLLCCKWPGLVHHPFRPFGDRFRRRHGLALSGLGVLLLALLGGFIFLYMNDAFAIFTG